MEGIVHYVRMRHDSARAQLKRLRRTMPRTVDGFPPAARAAATGGLVPPGLLLTGDARVSGIEEKTTCGALE